MAFEIHNRGSMPGAPPLFAGKTNAEGELVVQLDWKGLHGGNRPDWIGRVTEPGYQQHFVRLDAQRPGEEACRMTLLAIPGGTVRGRVIRGSGQGVEASVSLQRWAPRGTTRTPYPPQRMEQNPQEEEDPIQVLDLIASATYLGAGHFEIHIEDNASGMLLASRPGVGGACLPDLVLDPNNPRQDLIVVLQGPGILRGRLTDSAGVPIEGHHLVARHAEFDEAREGRYTNDFEGDKWRVEGAGCLSQRMITDEHGWFVAEGLRFDRYVIRANKQHMSRDLPLLLTKQPVLADGIQLELVMEDAAPPPLSAND